MAEPSNAAPPRPLKASEVLLLEYLREHADADGCASYTRNAIAGALGLAPSTAQLAVTGLVEAGLLGVDRSAGGRANIYCVTPTGPTDGPTDSTDRTDRSGPTGPTDSPSADAPPPERPSATRRRGSPPPTPQVPETATRSGDPLAHEGAPAREPTDRPTDRPTPIGQAAVAAAVEAAAAAGRSIDRSVLGRLGRAAQALAAEHEPGEVLDAARRIGEGAGDDLYTAMRAVKRGAPLPASVRSGDADARYADLQHRAELSRQGRDPLWLGRLKPGEIVEAEALYVGTYGERRRFDAELWQRELATFPIGAILWGIRAMAKASPHPPTWGEVAAAAGPTLEHERRKRANARARREDGVGV